jgi:hypothetical protein
VVQRPHADRSKVSDGGHETRRLEEQREAVRCSA